MILEIPLLYIYKGSPYFCNSVEKIIVLGMEETPEDCISFLQMVIMDDGSLYDEREPTNVYEDIVVLPFSSGTTGT